MSKVSFDSITRTISIIEAPALINGELTIFIDVQKDLYSQGKIDWIADETLRKLNFPIRSVGGDLTPSGDPLGDTYFLASDWKITPYEASHRFQVSGNFYSEDGTTPFKRTVGDYNVFFEQTVSTLVEVVSTGDTGSITEQDKLDIADRVWDETLADHQDVGSTGEKLEQGSTGGVGGEDWTETERAYILATLAETRGWAEIAASNTEGLVSGQDWTPEERDTILDGIMEAKGWARISAENTES